MPDLRSAFIAVIIALLLAAGSAAQGVKRVVVMKIDGLPGYYVDKFVRQRDPQTGRSVLPWFDEVFYKNGTRVPNFYTRGMSLSGPSWGQIDSGQHLQIKGNVEYDRFTLHAYDYLNFIPFYVAYGRGQKADMPATEVMDQLKIPLICDAFDFDRRYTSPQLYQRGNDWTVISSGFLNMIPHDPGDLIDEWTLGFDYRAMTVDQTERDIESRVVKHPEIDYLDYYDTSFDHVSHHNNDTASRLNELKKLDKAVGRVWKAIQSSSRADETALMLVSDHGFNSDPEVYSQGFNLVKLLASRAGGGHHVITKRRLMLDYSLKSIYPFVPLIRTSSKDSYYLQGQSGEYPTALLDFDGNERSSIHLRDSDLNLMHILLEQLKSGQLSRDMQGAAAAAFFEVLDRRRAEWRRTAVEVTHELDALHRWIVSEKAAVAALPRPENEPRGDVEKRRRRAAQLAIAIETETDYRKYILSLTRLVSLTREGFHPKQIKIEDLIAPGAMGSANSLYELQNYIVGPGPAGLKLKPDGDLDLDSSFTRVNYFDLLLSQRVRNNVQAKVGSRPIDFIAVRVPLQKIIGSLPADTQPDDDPVLLFGGTDRQALLLSKKGADGSEDYRYLPVKGVSQNGEGSISITVQDWTTGLPLKFLEDPNFAVPADQRVAWLSGWHSEIEWLDATHKCRYSDAMIGLNEQMDRHPVDPAPGVQLTDDEKLIHRFRERQRQLTEADLLILANDHWNFDVRGFNPGGNHGSFFRESTNATFLIAGGSKTGIPRGLTVEQPYDNLSFAPTLFRLMGKIDGNNEPDADLRRRGFEKFPGRVIEQLLSSDK